MYGQIFLIVKKSDDNWTSDEQEKEGEEERDTSKDNSRRNSKNRRT